MVMPCLAPHLPCYHFGHRIALEYPRHCQTKKRSATWILRYTPYDTTLTCLVTPSKEMDMSRLGICISVLICVLVLSPVSRAATIHVPSEQPTIQAGIDAAIAGDTVLVACGTYYEHDITMKSGVCLLSESGSAECVTIDAQQLGSVIICAEVDDTTSIIGFTITGASTTGIRIYHAELLIAYCDIVGNSGHLGGGIKMGSENSPTIEHCRILDNYAVDGAGIFCSGGSPTFSYCLIAGNEAQFWGGGMQLSAFNRTPTLSHCTVVDNIAGADGGGVFGANRCRFILQNTIIAFNDDGGIHIQDALTYESIDCCDVYANVGGNYTGQLGDLTGVDGNISDDPLFCDRPNGDFTLDGASPCAPPQSGSCGLVGAYEVGCGAVPIEPATWGSVKASFR